MRDPPTTAPRTPDQRLRVFVSSTLQELEPERRIAKAAVQNLRLTPVLFELGARAHPPQDLYRAYLAQSDVFVAIYAESYGWIAPGAEISGIEDEYRLAGPMPKLVYVKHVAHRDDRLARLIQQIQQRDGVTTRSFREASELEGLIEDDLAILLSERFGRGIDPGPAPADPDDAPAAPPPLERGELVGRDSEVAAIRDQLARPDVAVVTLAGPGGVGKTRLAVHVAHAVVDRFPDGVFYVPLAAVRAAHEVVPVVAEALQIPVPPGPADLDRLVQSFFRHRAALLVLDNFEQVIGAADAIARWAAASPRLKCLVTSREALRIRGEAVLPVLPLAHAPSEHPSAAMRLFEQRAREVRPDFALDARNRPAVFEICRRVDALPLAIELAAARIKVLTPDAMLSRLDRALGLLAAGRRDAPERHQALRATLDWSHDLLTEPERVFFRRLGVFSGSFPEDAVASVVGDDALDPLDGLGSLLDKSLVARADGDGRFYLLETVREYALERLASAGEERDAGLRHAGWVADLLASLHDALGHGPHRDVAAARLAVDDGNVRAALRRMARPEGDRDLAWRLFVHFAWARSLELRPGDVVRYWMEIERLGPPSDPVQAALVEGIGRGWMSCMAPSPTTIPALEAACATLRASGERQFLPTLLTALGTARGWMDPAGATAALEEALDRMAGADVSAVSGWARMSLFLAHLRQGDLARAERVAQDLLEGGQRVDDGDVIGFGKTALGQVQVVRGDLAAARVSFADAAAFARSRQGAYAKAAALSALASVEVAMGDLHAGRALMEELLVFIVDRSGSVTTLEFVLGGLAGLLVRDGELRRAATLLAAVPPGIEDDPGLAMQRDLPGALVRLTREARAAVGPIRPVDPGSLDPRALVDAALGRS